MNKPYFNEPDISPNDQLIKEAFEDFFPLWKKFEKKIVLDFPEFSSEWKYYKDGKAWLMKVQKKTKTIFWCGIYDDGIKAIFYFTDKVLEHLENSNIPKSYIDQFLSGKYYNKIRAFTVELKSENHLQYILDLINIKLMLK